MGKRTLETSQRSQVRPLTRCNSEGVPYQRDAEVTSQIESALELPPARLVQQAQITDEQSSDYLREEVLVYFIRECYRDGREDIVRDLVEVFLRRCGKRIYSKLRQLGPEASREAYNDIIAKLFERILDLEGDRGDFLQIRFWMAVKRLRITVYRSYITRARNEKNVDNFSTLEHSLSGADGEEDDLVFEEKVPSTDLSVEEHVLLQEALGALEEPYRTAFLLRNAAGWQIESNDPRTPTIAEHFGKTPRTIRNWLATAENQLKGWRDGRDKNA